MCMIKEDWCADGNVHAERRKQRFRVIFHRRPFHRPPDLSHPPRATYIFAPRNTIERRGIKEELTCY